MDIRSPQFLNTLIRSQLHGPELFQDRLATFSNPMPRAKAYLNFAATIIEAYHLENNLHSLGSMIGVMQETKGQFNSYTPYNFQNYSAVKTVHKNELDLQVYIENSKKIAFMIDDIDLDYRIVRVHPLIDVAQTMMFTIKNDKEHITTKQAAQEFRTPLFKALDKLSQRVTLEQYGDSSIETIMYTSGFSAWISEGDLKIAAFYPPTYEPLTSLCETINNIPPKFVRIPNFPKAYFPLSPPLPPKIKN